MFFTFHPYYNRSFDEFVDAASKINNGASLVADFQESLATIASTYRTTAILEAGRMSLDAKGAAVHILYEDHENPCRPTKLESTNV